MSVFIFTPLSSVFFFYAFFCSYAAINSKAQRGGAESIKCCDLCLPSSPLSGCTDPQISSFVQNTLNTSSRTANDRSELQTPYVRQTETMRDKSSEYYSVKGKGKAGNVQGQYPEEDEPDPTERKKQCQHKKTCKNLKTCQEARFFLEVCGFSKLDRDKDGIPCENLCR